MLITAASVVLICMHSSADHVPIDIEKFHEAISRGDVAEVRRMIEDGADVNLVDDSDCTPIITAATFGRPQVLQLLLSAGADPHHKGRAGRTSLYCAAGAMRNSSDCVRVLLRHGAEVDQTTQSGRTPLMLACLYGRYESAVLLLDAGADCYARDADGQGPLWYAACAYGDDLRLLRLLVALGCEADGVDNRGWSPLHHAASAGRLSAVRFLIAAGADRQRPTGKGSTPMDLAGRFEVRLALGGPMKPSQPTPPLEAPMASGPTP